MKAEASAKKRGKGTGQNAQKERKKIAPFDQSEEVGSQEKMKHWDWIRKTEIIPS